jgi:hypothetical protein
VAQLLPSSSASISSSCDAVNSPSPQNGKPCLRGIEVIKKCVPCHLMLGRPMCPSYCVDRFFKQRNKTQTNLRENLIRLIHRVPVMHVLEKCWFDVVRKEY